MPSFSIQFHATIEELAELAAEWAQIHPVHAAAVEYHPFAVLKLDPSDVRDCVMRDQVRRLIFTEQTPDLAVSGNNELLDRNDGALLLDIGRLGARGLNESRLSTTHVTARWREFAAHLKRKTSTGVVGTHEKTGASASYRNHRYTHGAKLLWETGTPLRPFAQSPVVLRPDTP